MPLQSLRVGGRVCPRPELTSREPRMVPPQALGPQWRSLAVPCRLARRQAWRPLLPGLGHLPREPRMVVPPTRPRFPVAQRLAVPCCLA